MQATEDKHNNTISSSTLKVTVSSSDPSQCIVAAKFLDDYSFIALCRPQDENWTIVEGPDSSDPDEYIFLDFLFSDEKLYVCCCFLGTDEDYLNAVSAFQTHSISLGRGFDAGTFLYSNA